VGGGGGGGGGGGVLCESQGQSGNFGQRLMCCPLGNRQRIDSHPSRSLATIPTTLQRDIFCCHRDEKSIPVHFG